jgi:hypothetical protein
MITDLFLLCRRLRLARLRWLATKEAADVRWHGGCSMNEARNMCENSNREEVERRTKQKGNWWSGGANGRQL